MIPQTYFSKFNLITYDNSTAVDITERIVIKNASFKNPYNYYPIIISDGTRADTLAYNLYENPYYSWVAYLSNNIIDPYYQWYLTEKEMSELYRKKYGSIVNALEKVKYFINDYTNKPEISVSRYDTLSVNQRIFWEPNYNQTGKVQSYKRRKEDWTSTTNFVLAIGISGNSNFIKDEIVSIKYDHNYNGKAQVLLSNSTFCLVHHIFDDAFPHDNIVINSNSYMYGSESKSNVAILSCNFVANNISADTLNYWKPVYYYEFEQEKNEGNKLVNMLKSNFIEDFNRDVGKKLAKK
jgi:hypothetical protein